ncbi:uncharacterized protein LOC142162389 [Nicotiana tabacum]|uniref:Uncharacterized protein LOC142162389 n=1 Tax=Nicotiana tabacum TaxID=4097 RepID=A0AC58RQ27_TOBAC
MRYGELKSHVQTTWRKDYTNVSGNLSSCIHVETTGIKEAANYPAPSRTISSSNETVTNPAYPTWFHQDQLIQNAILALVDSTLAASVASANTLKAAWDALHIVYANKSQMRIFSLRDRLACLAKNALPGTDYMH